LLIGVFALCAPTAAARDISVAVVIAPPPLPVYVQPICPGEDYIWTPGYWAYADGDYYWVPGTWVLAPEVGFLWTPPYWAFVDGAFLFHEGYWGPHVGFYGGVAYGFGYFGVGFNGGRWENDHFYYNRAVSHINETEIHNVYNMRVNERVETRVSYNGGPNGINAHATAEEEAAARERHIAPAREQARHVEAARGNPELRASANLGKPPIAATGRPGELKGRAVVGAREAGGPYHPEKNGGTERHAADRHEPERPVARTEAERPEARQPANTSPRASAVHPRDLPPAERPSRPNSGDAKQDQKYQQQQEQLMAKQEKDRQKLQQSQDREHQQLARQKANESRQQQVEQRHQQQTEKMTQQHAAQQQKLQQRQQPPPTHNASKPPSGGRPERP